MDGYSHIQEPIYAATMPWNGGQNDAPMGNQQHTPLTHAEHVEGSRQLLGNRGNHWHFNDPVFGLQLPETKPALDIKPVRKLDEIRR